jgi:hypothetical protein
MPELNQKTYAGISIAFMCLSVLVGLISLAYPVALLAFLPIIIVRVCFTYFFWINFIRSLIHMRASYIAMWEVTGADYRKIEALTGEEISLKSMFRWRKKRIAQITKMIMDKTWTKIDILDLK